VVRVDLPSHVTFSTKTDLPLPNPQYIKMHAAICRVAAKSGATRLAAISEHENGWSESDAEEEDWPDWVIGEEDDDDDYWASYDRTPGRTPAQKQSPAPPAFAAAQAADRQGETDYYARYGAEVQPAMDAHDPDEEHPELGESTLNGDSLLRSQHQDGRVSRPNGTSMFPADDKPPDAEVEAPRPISPTSSHGSSIERLESRAAEMSAESPGAMDRAQMAVKQHISTDVKSLFRLAKNSGMEREEFERIVRTELECLTLLEQDD